MAEKEKQKFKIKNVSEYLDLGTLKEWLSFKGKTKTYFIDIDGVVVKNSAEYWEPYWGTTEGIAENVETIKKLHESGSQIIFVTTRKEEYRKITEEQLARLGLKYHSLVMGAYHTTRVLINDFANSNSYPSALAINIARDSNNLGDFIAK